jgi:hypothetical protein
VRILVTTGLREELSRLIPMAIAGILLGIASAIIVLDHPVEPLDPPLPSVDPAKLAKVAGADRATRAHLERNPLPPGIRAVGSAFLEWNAAAARGTDPRDPAREALALEIRSALGVARSTAGGEAPLAVQLSQLRAYHADFFIEELARGVRTNVVDPSSPEPQRSEELKRLGGGLIDILARNRWIDERGKLLAPEPVIRARYKLHWTSIVYSLEDCEGAPPPVCYGLTTLPVEPIELRALLAYLIAYPVTREQDVIEAGTAERAIDRRRLVYLERLAALDQHADPRGEHRPYLGDYPLELARGALLHRLGRYDLAADELGQWAATHRNDGRARNWYLGALAKMRGD